MNAETKTNEYHPADKLHSEASARKNLRKKIRIKDDIGVKAVGLTTRAGLGVAEKAAHNSDNKDDDSAELDDLGSEGLQKNSYSKKLKQSRKDAKKAGKLEENRKTLNSQAQKEAIKKKYARQWRQDAEAEAGRKTAGLARRLVTDAKDMVSAMAEYVMENPKVILIISIFMLLMMFVVTMVGTCATGAQMIAQTMVASSYTAQDRDILTVEGSYIAKEAELRNRVSRVERDYPGYDEYQYDIAEIGHDPYQLASYLTAVIEDYTPSEAACYVENLFNNQYRLTLTPVTETRYRPIYDEYGEYVGEEPYDYHILRVGLTNRGIDAVVRSMGLYNTELERYEILLQTKGNKSYLFEDSIYANVAEYLEYDIPGEALTDQAFANMIAEAEKYLGMSYVWGGSDPSTGFDCSGFVSYVINNSGNGWNVGRKTANGLKNSCDIIRSEEAKPGDLIFFKGTYGVSGASHVGIYVGNNMMIHCGNPISYAHTDTAYWQEHFYCFGRLP